jgi:hypothetical protein
MTILCSAISRLSGFTVSMLLPSDRIRILRLLDNQILHEDGESKDPINIDSTSYIIEEHYPHSYWTSAEAWNHL